MSEFKRSVTTINTTNYRIDGIIIETGHDDEPVVQVNWFTTGIDGTLEHVPSEFANILEMLYQKEEREREIHIQKALELMEDND